MATSVWITAESLGGLVGSAGGGASYDCLGWRWSALVVAGLQAGAVMMVVSLVSLNLVTSYRHRKRKPGTGPKEARSINREPRALGPHRAKEPKNQARERPGAPKQ